MNAVLLSVMMVSAPVAEARVAGVQCEADHECGVGMYCYESQLCTACTNCAVYNRDRPPEYPVCPKSAQQCGQCLKGYVEEILTDGSRRDMCQFYAAHNSLGVNVFIYAAVAIVACAIICIGAFFYVKRRKGSNSSEHTCGDPPPYIEGISPLIQHAEQRIVVTDVLGTQVGNFCCSKDRLNDQAIPYIDPQPPYGSEGESDEPEVNGGILDDNEDTVPSVWAPPPNYGNSSNSSSRSSLVSLPEPFTDEDDEDRNTSNDSGTSEAGELHTSSSLPTVATQSEPAVACSTHSLDEDVAYTQAPKRPRMAVDSGTASMEDVASDSASFNVQVNIRTDIHIVQNNVNIDSS